MDPMSLRLTVSCLVVAFAVITSAAVAVAVPTNDITADQLDHVGLERDDDRRATWLETRNIEENFKELVYLSLQELASEGVVNPEVLTGETVVDKRGRHQGFCFRKTKSGRFLPYICWKEGR